MFIRTKSARVTWTTIAIVGSTSCIAFAAELQSSRLGRLGDKLAEWQVVVGAGALMVPKYEGSDEFEVLPVPFVSARLFDALTIDPTGATVTLFNQGAFKLGAKVGYEMGREEDDGDRLGGLGDVDGGVTAGAKASIQFGPAEFFAEVDKTISGSDGLVGRLGVEVTQPLSPSWVIGAGASAIVADEKHMQAYFGITPEQAARSGLPAYEIGAGLKRADFSLSATYLADHNWMIRAEARLGVLVGDAADSPIVVEKLQPSAMLGVGYRF